MSRHDEPENCRRCGTTHFDGAGHTCERSRRVMVIGARPTLSEIIAKSATQAPVNEVPVPASAYARTGVEVLANPPRIPSLTDEARTQDYTAEQMLRAADDMRMLSNALRDGVAVGVGASQDEWDEWAAMLRQCAVVLEREHRTDEANTGLGLAVLEERLRAERAEAEVARLESERSAALAIVDTELAQVRVRAVNALTARKALESLSSSERAK